MNKTLYYILSFTWGLPITLVGCLVAACLLIVGYKPERWHYCFYFTVGKTWGGVNLGPIFLMCANGNEKTKAHEAGHSIQNCIFGPLTPLLVIIPSATRYWYRRWLVKSGRKTNAELPDYYSIWFEKQANELGIKMTMQND